MIRYENHCCECAVPGYPCEGKSCSQINVPVYYCDFCDNDTCAEYDIDGEHYCKEHAEELFVESFTDLTTEEKAELLHTPCRRLE